MAQSSSRQRGGIHTEGLDRRSVVGQRGRDSGRVPWPSSLARACALPSSRLRGEKQRIRWRVHRRSAGGKTMDVRRQPHPAHPPRDAPRARPAPRTALALRRARQHSRHRAGACHTGRQFFFFCSSVWIRLPMVSCSSPTRSAGAAAWTSPTPWLAGLANRQRRSCTGRLPRQRKQVVDVALAGLQLLTLLGETAYGCGWFASVRPTSRPTPPAAADVARHRRRRRRSHSPYRSRRHRAIAAADGVARGAAAAWRAVGGARRVRVARRLPPRPLAAAARLLDHLGHRHAAPRAPPRLARPPATPAAS